MGITLPSSEAHTKRQFPLSLLSGFFAVGSAISLFAGASIVFPGSFAEAIWSLNPSARQAFLALGAGAIYLLSVLCVSCAVASVGLWLLRPYGYAAAVLLLVANLLGDAANVILGTEPRAAFGLPIVAAILWYLSRSRVRQQFFRAKRAA